MKIIKLLAVAAVVLAGRSAATNGAVLIIDDPSPSVEPSAIGCSFELDATSAHFTTAGGPGTVTVTASAANCSWSATSYSPFVTVTSPTNFTGDGVVTYSVADNTNHVGFTGVILIAGQTFLAVQDAFSVRRGTYNGVIIQTNAPSNASSGSIKLKLSERGTFTASLTLGGVRTSFKGKFDGGGNSTNTLRNKRLDLQHLVMQLSLFTASNDSTANSITGVLSNDTFTSALMAGVASLDRTNRCLVRGNYTFILAPADRNDPTVPQGYGFGTLDVQQNGQTKMTGSLGDGTTISLNVPVSLDGNWTLYKTLYKNQGSCVGWVTLSTNSPVSSSVDWFKPPIPGDRLYPAGFTTSAALDGGIFVSPFSGGPPIAGTGTLTLGGGGLAANIVKNVLIETNGTITVSPPGNDKVTLTINTATGEFGGSFLNPAIHQTSRFTGQFVQTNRFGAGFFLGTDRSGFVTIELTP